MMVTLAGVTFPSEMQVAGGGEGRGEGGIEPTRAHAQLLNDCDPVDRSP